MDLLTIVAIAVGLSMDALAVSVSNGLAIKKIKFQHAFQIAFAFGFFQFLMPVLGWSAGISLSQIIVSYDHWVAFVLLLFVGGKMLYEAHFLEEESEKKNCLHLPTLLLMAIATSIDALAVGFSFACLSVSILQPVLIIGSVTFAICLAGIYIGQHFGRLFEDKLEYLGGLVLISIGLKILIEHLLTGV